MNVRTLCLSILQTQEASGYEIRKMCTEGECAYFVEASYGSIYPALAKLEDEGLVTSRIEHQSGKPSKKIYAITDAGRNAFVESLHEPLGDEVYRSPFLLFARFAHLLPSPLVATRLEERSSALGEEIAELKRIRDENGCSDATSPLSHPNDMWVLNYGIHVLEVARAYLDTHMDELIASAKDGDVKAKAAE